MSGNQVSVEPNTKLGSLLFANPHNASLPGCRIELTSNLDRNEITFVLSHPDLAKPVTIRLNTATVQTLFNCQDLKRTDADATLSTRLRADIRAKLFQKAILAQNRWLKQRPSSLVTLISTYVASAAAELDYKASGFVRETPSVEPTHRLKSIHLVGTHRHAEPQTLQAKPKSAGRAAAIARLVYPNAVLSPDSVDQDDADGSSDGTRNVHHWVDLQTLLHAQDMQVTAVDPTAQSPNEQPLEAVLNDFIALLQQRPLDLSEISDGYLYYAQPRFGNRYWPELKKTVQQYLDPFTRSDLAITLVHQAKEREQSGPFLFDLTALHILDLDALDRLLLSDPHAIRTLIALRSPRRPSEDCRLGYNLSRLSDQQLLETLERWSQILSAEHVYALLDSIGPQFALSLAQREASVLGQLWRKYKFGHSLLVRCMKEIQLYSESQFSDWVRAYLSKPKGQEVAFVYIDALRTHLRSMGVSARRLRHGLSTDTLPESKQILERYLELIAQTVTIDTEATLFTASGIPDPSHIDQNHTRDCWVLAGLIGISAQYPQSIKDHIRVLDGKAQVLFYDEKNAAHWVEVTLDQARHRSWVDTTPDCSPTEILWPAIIEVALEKFMQNQKPYGHTTITKGGYSEDFFKIWFGPHAEVKWYNTRQKSAAEIMAAYQKNQIIVFGSYVDFDQPSNPEQPAPHFRPKSTPIRHKKEEEPYSHAITLRNILVNKAGVIMGLIQDPQGSSDGTAFNTYWIDLEAQLLRSRIYDVVIVTVNDTL